MNKFTTTKSQDTIIQAPNDAKVFLTGPAGTGKTTAAVGRLRHLLESGIPGDSILVLLPQRSLAEPYAQALRDPQRAPGGNPDILTIGGLARRGIDLFWPLIAAEAGFNHPERPPTFLTLETAQYFMAEVISPLMDQGYFDTVVIQRNRLFSQILDNLNKTAVTGIPINEIGERLSAAWLGETAQRRIYREAGECALKFRQFCLDNNLLDFSLQIQIFRDHLWPYPLCREHITHTYQHLIVDNIEEDTPIAHDLVLEWLPECSSALIVLDEDAGYRHFLGADPISALRLREACDQVISLRDSFVTTDVIESLGLHLCDSLGQPRQLDGLADPRQALIHRSHRFFPEMLDWVSDEISRLINEEDIPAGQIVVLAPYLPDVLRFALQNRLDSRGVPSRSHRPSRPLSAEPATRCLLTLAKIAHPDWGFAPRTHQVTDALMQAIADLDLPRANLLSQIVYRSKKGELSLSSFDDIKSDMQERITFRVGERYNRLREWMLAYQAGPMAELDHFFSRLFGELLSQAGYGFHADLDAGGAAANLIESVAKFRRIKQDSHSQDDAHIGQEYLDLVEDGLVAAQYLHRWTTQEEDAVSLTPAYTFLMSNRPVEVQFWLNPGSLGWFERLYQPLTQPYVLSRNWPMDKTWGAIEELEANRATLRRLIQGLVRRCRRVVYLGTTTFGEGGYEQRGPLLQAIQNMLRNLPPLEGSDV